MVSEASRVLFGGREPDLCAEWLGSEKPMTQEAMGDEAIRAVGVCFLFEPVTIDGKMPEKIPAAAAASVGVFRGTPSCDLFLPLN